MKISVLTLFPEYFEPLMTTSILKRAKEKDLFEFEKNKVSSRQDVKPSIFVSSQKKNMDMWMIHHMVVVREWY